MEVLLLAIFFIVSLIFFILGKDDFGRKGEKVKEEININKNQGVTVKEKDIITEVVKEDVKEEIKKEIES